MEWHWFSGSATDSMHYLFGRVFTFPFASIGSLLLSQGVFFGLDFVLCPHVWNNGILKPIPRWRSLVASSIGGAMFPISTVASCYAFGMAPALVCALSGAFIHGWMFMVAGYGGIRSGGSKDTTLSFADQEKVYFGSALIATVCISFLLSK